MKILEKLPEGPAISATINTILEQFRQRQPDHTGRVSSAVPMARMEAALQLCLRVRQRLEQLLSSQGWGPTEAENKLEALRGAAYDKH